ncbi:hypothetical protein [Phormidesmis sp. 146-33]
MRNWVQSDGGTLFFAPKLGDRLPVSDRAGVTLDGLRFTDEGHAPDQGEFAQFRLPDHQEAVYNPELKISVCSDSLSRFDAPFVGYGGACEEVIRWFAHFRKRHQAKNLKNQ